MEKVAIYCRVSTQEQRERQSINTQIEYIQDYCKKEGLIIFDTYRDDGFLLRYFEKVWVILSPLF